VTGRQAPHTFTSGGAQVLGLIFKELPTNSADEAKDHGAKNSGQQSQTIDFTLGEVIAGYKDDVLAAALRSPRRKITAGKKEGEFHQVNG
jgi:two-component sensor histidine kinase